MRNLRKFGKKSLPGWGKRDLTKEFFSPESQEKKDQILGNITHSFQRKTHPDFQKLFQEMKKQNKKQKQKNNFKKF